MNFGWIQVFFYFGWIKLLNFGCIQVKGVECIWYQQVPSAEYLSELDLQRVNTKKTNFNFQKMFIGPRYNYVILADEDTNSILTDNATRAIQGNVAMQITQSG